MAKLFVDMPKTLTGFAPLGIVLVIMLGAAVAEQGRAFLSTYSRKLKRFTRRYMTPVVAVIGMRTHHASDAGYVVFIPLCALIYADAGRHHL